MTMTYYQDILCLFRGLIRCLSKANKAQSSGVQQQLSENWIYNCLNNTVWCFVRLIIIGCNIECDFDSFEFVADFVDHKQYVSNDSRKLTND